MSRAPSNVATDLRISEDRKLIREIREAITDINDPLYKAPRNSPTDEQLAKAEKNRLRRETRVLSTKEQEQAKVRARKHYLANKQKVLERTRAKQKNYTPEQKAEIAAYAREWRIKNKERLAAAAREKRRLFPDLAKAADYKRNYGITIEEYNKLFLEQHGVCKVCKKPEITKRLSVDHCHTTKKVRGLLCHACNTAIGLMKEDQETVSAIAEYLKQPN